MSQITTSTVDFYYVFQGVCGHALPFNMYARGRLGMVKSGTPFIRMNDILVPERIEMLDVSGFATDGTVLNSQELKTWWPQNFWGPYGISVVERKAAVCFRASMDAPLRPLSVAQRYESLPATPGEAVQKFSLEFDEVISQLEKNPLLFHGLLGAGVFLRNKSGVLEPMHTLSLPK